MTDCVDIGNSLTTVIDNQQLSTELEYEIKVDELTGDPVVFHDIPIS
jgi:hypothetical protein